MKNITRDKLTKMLERAAKQAKEAQRELALLPAQKKNAVLEAMADGLISNIPLILQANKLDLKAALKKGLSPAFIERLTLNERRVRDMAVSLREIAKLPSPVGEEIKSWNRPNGLNISKVRVPIGVILIIYESRPNVTADCAGLCFKSGNAVILRGGSDACFSNAAVYRVLKKTVLEAGISPSAITLVDAKDRLAVDILLELEQYINLVMPRGGESLIKEVRDKSKIPVIKHYKGVCHVYVDARADMDMARRIILNAKVQRPGVCNAMETLLVHEKIAPVFLPLVVGDLQRAGVEVRGCPATRKIVKTVSRALEEDWWTEYLALILSVRVVKDISGAIAHINHYGSGHSDSIVTKNRKAAERFLAEVDSACVYLNASTRFTDGQQFGFGAEIGISTDRLQARGPVGLEELTTYKYVIRGTGQIRE